MTLFKPQVGKVIFAQTTGRLSVIIPFFFLVSGGSDRVRFPGRSNRLVGDDVISDIIALEGTCGTCKCMVG